MQRTHPTSIRLEDYRSPAFLIDQVELNFQLAAGETLVEASLEVRRNPAAAGALDLRLDGEQLELEAITIDGRSLAAAEYRVDAESLTLFKVPDRFRLHTRVRIHPERNTALEGLYDSNGMLCTQCEAEGFRRITYYLDRPDVLACFSVTLEADKALYPVLLANGNPAGSEDLPGNRHRARWVDPFPKPSYLFALVAGDLYRVSDRFRTASGRKVGLNIWVEPENLDKCGHALYALKNAMGWDEDNYGREYDLDVYNIVAVSHFNMGAMENKGLNIFNAKAVLASPDTATDQDFQWVEGVIAHEYFHNWSGNRVTLRDWFQLSLKEGFTVFRDQEFSADRGSRGVKRITDVRHLRDRQFAEDAGPLAHPVRPDSYLEINNFYTATVYEKGAELIRMQALLLGPDLFRRATDLYFSRHDGQAVTTDDFVACMEEASGRDLTQFKRWYSQAGTPELDISGHYDPRERTYEMRVRQHTPPTPGQPRKEPLHIPLALGLLDGQGRDLPLRLAGEAKAPRPGTRLLELREEEGLFRFIEVPEPPLPSLLRGFSAPVKVRFDYSDADLMFLMAHDSDGFNRWEAAQTLSQRLLLALTQEPGLPIPPGYAQACRRALTDKRSEPALIAEVLNLPSESYMADQMSQVDVDAIHRAREALRLHLAGELRAELLAVYRANRQSGPHQTSPEAMGQRALKNLCLALLVAGGEGEALAWCQAQFTEARNMTDQVAALRLLVDRGGSAGAEALAAFYRTFVTDPLVLDKWFAIQAAAEGPDTLERVRRLRDHPAFSLTNPNRVRSLVATFCANQVRFHDKDGGGYAFLGDRVIELDPINPQIAARLLQHLVRWRRFDPARQRLMRGQLERILAVPDLSKDTYEVAAKGLA